MVNFYQTAQPLFPNLNCADPEPYSKYGSGIHNKMIRKDPLSILNFMHCKYVPYRCIQNRITR